MRCFVAVALGDRVATAVAATVAQLREAASRAGLRVSWTRPEGWHATVKFLGEIDDALVTRTHEALLGAFGTGAPPAFVAEAEGVIGLPSSGIPRVLAVSLHDGGCLEALARHVDDALGPLGFERERRAYVPHVTIGRLRDRLPGRAGWKRFADALAAASDRGFGRTEVGEVGLYQSRLGGGGSRYERLQCYRLEGRPRR